MTDEKDPGIPDEENVLGKEPKQPEPPKAQPSAFDQVEPVSPDEIDQSTVAKLEKKLNVKVTEIRRLPCGCSRMAWEPPENPQMPKAYTIPCLVHGLEAVGAVSMEVAQALSVAANKLAEISETVLSSVEGHKQAMIRAERDAQKSALVLPGDLPMRKYQRGRGGRRPRH